MQVCTSFSGRGRGPQLRRLALLSAAVAACFAAGVTQASSMLPADPGWQSSQAPARQTGTRRVRDARAQASTAQAYVELSRADQGGPDWYPMTAVRAKQGGPGRPAPDALVDESTQLANPVADNTMTSGNALTPDRAAIAIDIQFPPDSTNLSGEAVTALDSVAAVAGDLPGAIVITARADPIERNARGLEVSMARARSVRSYLARVGVDPRRIVVRAIGNAQARVDPRLCEGMTGAGRESCFAPDRTVTVQVGQLDVGMADTAGLAGVMYSD